MKRVVSLFCGIGQMDSGFEAAGFEIVAAYDSWPKAVEVYNANHSPVAIVADLKQMQRTDLPPHDLVIGGPPCQPFSLAGKRTGHSDPRNCLPDFQRLVGFGQPDESPYLMENVVPMLIRAPWAERLNASHYGDVTTRKRWFYSNYLLHIFPNPGPRRIRDIREAGADEKAVNRMAWLREQNGKRWGLKPRGDDEFIGALGSGDAHGMQTASTLLTMHKAGHHDHYADDEHLASLTAHAWHGHDVRNGKLLRIGGTPAEDDGFMPSVTAGKGGVSGYPMLKLGLRGPSWAEKATTFADDEHLGSMTANAYRQSASATLEGCRNPTLLEMARAHSIPDEFDWCGATKTDRGKMIANGCPIGMSRAVAEAMNRALGGR